MSALIPNLVPSFIVEPVLRQARRFSRGSFASPAVPAPSADSTASASSPLSAQQEDGDQQGSSSSGGIGAAGRGRLLEGHAEDAGDQDPAIAAVDGGLGPQPSSSSLNRPLPDRLAPGPPHPTSPTSQTPPSASPAQGARESPLEEASSRQQHHFADQATASPGMAAAQRDPIATQDGAPAPSAAVSANDGTISAMPEEYLRPEALPEDDGMGPLRRRILEIHSRPIPAAEKAQLLHSMFTEGYERSRQDIQEQQKKKRVSSHSSHSATSEGGDRGVLYEQAAPQGPLESLKFWQLSLGESSTPPRFLLTEDDLKPTYAPVKPRQRGRDGTGSGVFLPTGEFISSSSSSNSSSGPQQQEPQHMGCEHYRRNVKLQCNTCQKWYTCRLCHDDAEDHALPRKETKNMLCMPCGYAQKAGDECVRCGRLAARYYCGICKLWNDDPDASTYHCDGCGICRVGAGLGKDFFHCKSCGICIAIETKDSHRCREGAMDCNCPICGEYMFTSTKRMIHMNPCRHLIHKRCYEQHMLTSYKCPICSKSTRNMESLFRKWDQNIAEQPMPSEWAAARAIIYCNDCEAKSQTLYHWVGLKCSICKGYNTREVQILNAPGSGPPTTAAAPPPGKDDSAAGTSLTAAGGEEAGTASAASAATETATATLAAPTAVAGEAALPDMAHRSSASSGPRDIAQPRRSVSHMPGASVGGMRTTLPVQPPERYARSLSPTPVFPEIEGDPEDSMMDDDDDVGRSNDMLDFDFWSRVGLGRLGGSEMRLFGEAGESHDDVDDEDDSEDDDDESSEEGDPREDEEDDDNEITLFGHR